MGLFRTENHFRRWVNLLPALMLPGSAHCLAGKNRRGILAFLLTMGAMAGMMVLDFHPDTPFDYRRMEWPDGLLIGLAALVYLDSLRWRIPRRGARPWLVVLAAVLVMNACSHFFKQQFYEPFIMPNDSMFPTLSGPSKLLKGDYLWIKKNTYEKSGPMRGDVIVHTGEGIDHPQITDESIFVKRIIGLPGEIIEWTPPHVLIDGQRPEAPRILVELMNSENLFSGLQWPKDHPIVKPVLLPDSPRIALGPDEYFVIGDNQEHTYDSRYFGPIKRGQIIGKAVYIASPAPRKGRIE